MSEAVIDTRNNTVISKKPIQFKSENRTIRANRLELSGSGIIAISNESITEDGNIIRFDKYAVP
jgi:hypothetical protein